MQTLDYITTNHVAGRHLIVQMTEFAAVATFERGDTLVDVCRKLRRLAADIEILSATTTTGPMSSVAAGSTQPRR